MSISPARRRPLAAFGLTLMLAGTAVAAAPSASAETPGGATDLVSVASDGGQTTEWPEGSSMSADGRYVVFSTKAALVPEDVDGLSDVYWRDRVTRTTALVSVATSGLQSDGISLRPAISGNGRVVAFTSNASNLLVGNNDGVVDTNGAFDVFLHNMDTGVTTLVSRAGNDSGNEASNGWSALSFDGRYVAFDSSASNLSALDNPDMNDVFRRDMVKGETVLVSIAQDGQPKTDGSSEHPAISSDGNVVAFQSRNVLIPEDQNGADDIYVRDLTGPGETSRAPSGEAPDEASSRPSLSADGRHLVYSSAADNLLGFGEDTNGKDDVFAYDRQTTELTRVSVDLDGNEAEGNAVGGTISGDGRWVSYYTDAPDSHPGSYPDFVALLRPRSGTTQAVVLSVDHTGAVRHGETHGLSHDGRYAAIESIAPLVAEDADGAKDVFVRTVNLPAITAVTPSVLDSGMAGAVTIYGSGFTATPALDLGPGVAVKNVTWISATELHALVEVDPGATGGPRLVKATNPAGDSATCETCLTVRTGAQTDTDPVPNPDPTPDGDTAPPDGNPVGLNPGPTGGDPGPTGSNPGATGSGDTRQELTGGGELPRTGGFVIPQVLAGLALAGSGGVLTAVARRRRP